jgi:hypothetical protein
LPSSSETHGRPLRKPRAKHENRDREHNFAGGPRARASFLRPEAKTFNAYSASTFILGAGAARAAGAALTGASAAV